MAVVAIFEGATFTQATYEESVRKLSGGKARMESTTERPFEGQLAHIAGQSKSGFRVVDVWESEDSFQRFSEKILPILRELGVKDKPEVYPAHTFISA